jgi:hypothetical protein
MGDDQDEHVAFENAGDDPLDLSEWVVSNGAGRSYRFPDGTTLPVSLATVDRWRDIKYTDDGPAVQRVLLPVSAAREIVRQVDAIARNAGLVDPATAEGDRAKYR